MEASVRYQAVIGNSPAGAINMPRAGRGVSGAEKAGGPGLGGAERCNGLGRCTKAELEEN